MTYQVIARKWRPQAFNEVTGQEHITQTLRNALEHDRLHHAYLFSGARGVGKTTTARLLAKALNCHKSDKPNILPCSSSDPSACASCIEISQSRSIDVFEFDAASHTKVEEIRDIILESINVAPARDRYKIFIIDEVHMLSTSSFNALLKTLEEPPRNVVFIMATTELHKLPDTILSRCQQFEFRTIPLQKIFDRLKLIADAESVEITDDALREIARTGEGSMRDAQSNFDQVISFSGDKIGVSDVATALGIAGTKMLRGVVEGILIKDRKAVLAVVGELTAQGHDLRNFCRDLLALFRDILVSKIGGSDLAESSIFGADDLSKFADGLSETDIIRLFNSLADTESRLKEATQSRYVLEVGLIKLIELRRLAPIEQVIERLSRLEASGEVPAPSVQSPVNNIAPEKKTLIPDRTAPPEVEMPSEPEEPPFIVSEPPGEFFAPEPEPRLATPVDLSFIDVLPVRLPPISSEDLEHVDDTPLDNAYEEKLMRSGDRLRPISNASELAAILSGGFQPASGSETADVPNRSNGSGGHSSNVDPAFAPPVFDHSDENGPLPQLPENPSIEDLMAFAEGHPLAKKAMRIFRAKIVEVRPNSL